MLDRLFPKQADNEFDGHRAALWLLGLFVFVKVAMTLNSIANTASVASGADGIPLGSFGPAAANEVLLLFSLNALGQLALALIALGVLVRYRALVPLLYLVLLGERLARSLILQSYKLPGAETTDIARYLGYGFLALLTLGLLLSLLPRRSARAAD